MATRDAVQDMGDTLVNLLRTAGIAGVAPGDILLATPDDFEGLATRAAPLPPTITVFLYNISLVTEMRNSPRRVLPDGRTTRALLPIDLHYMITPWAPAAAFEHRIAGAVLQLLYDHAELGPADLQGGSWSPGDTVQMILNPLPLEQQFQLWETTEAPYRLSLTYIARVIGIEPTEKLELPPVLEAVFGRGAS